MDNRWSGLFKLTMLPRTGIKLHASYQRSVAINQNTRMLQVTGNEDVIAPGFQYAFALQPDNANTYTHDNEPRVPRSAPTRSAPSTFYGVQLSRLFTRLRADANGADWRPRNVDTELDPTSIPGLPRHHLRRRRPTCRLTRRCSCCPAPASSTTAASPPAGTTTSPRRSPSAREYTRFTASQATS